MNYNNWAKVREVICPVRFYKYGTVGLNLHDDRSILEKLCDNIDKLLKPKTRKPKLVFRGWFDWSLGRYISSKDDIKQIEKETGYDLVNVADWERESKRQRAIIDKSHEEHLEKKLKGVIRDVQQGRKFTMESMEKRRRICREEGITRLPGGARI